MADVSVDPAALQQEYKPLDTPVRWMATRLSGESYEEIYRGVLRVEWDSPKGLFAMLLPQRDDLGRAAYDEMRPHIASLVARAYERQVADAAAGT